MRLYCTQCRQEWDAEIPRWQCACGGLLQLETTDFFTVSNLQKREFNLWRYREALPVTKSSNIISFEEGFTPCIEYQKNLLLKLDFLFPSGSFKDRGSTVLMSKIKEWGIAECLEDSSGNAGCSLACYAAKGNIKINIIIPKSCAAGKVKQLQAYGAEIQFCNSREEAGKMAIKLAQNRFYASHVWNPFFFHGTKTIAFEIWEQTQGILPDTIFVPLGNGTLLLGLYIGFKELQTFGFCKKIPRLIGVQAASCAPFVEGDISKPQETLAEGIAIANPLRKKEIVEAVAFTKGKFIAVSNQEIWEAQTELAKNGFYVEPTAAVGFSGMKKSDFSKLESSLVILTGSGLKSLYKK